MSKSLAEMPVTTYSYDDAVSQGILPTLLAQSAVECGPVFKRIVPEETHDAREFVFMVGPEANRFVLHTHRQYFSHERGWTPLIGPDFGNGLLNVICCRCKRLLLRQPRLLAKLAPDGSIQAVKYLTPHYDHGRSCTHR